MGAKQDAILGGLQNHSVGDIYPLAVVGYGIEPTLYAIENLQTGCVLCLRDGAPLHAESDALYFQHGVAEALSWGAKEFRCPRGGLILDLTALQWVQGRPVKDGEYLRMPKRELTPREEYYAAAEQDIG